MLKWICARKKVKSDEALQPHSLYLDFKIQFRVFINFHFIIKFMLIRLYFTVCWHCSISDVTCSTCAVECFGFWFLFDGWVTKTQSTHIAEKLGRPLSKAETPHGTGAEMKADALLRKFLTTTVNVYITKHRPPEATSGWKGGRGEGGGLLLCLHNWRHQRQACDCCVIVLISGDDTKLAVFSTSK